MGAANRKEALAEVHEAFTSDDPPNPEAFRQSLIRCHADLCGGSEWFTVAEPLVRSLIQHNPRNERLLWLLQFTTTTVLSYHQTTLADPGEEEVSAEKSLRGCEACCAMMELIMRHTFRLMRQDLTVLNAQLERNETGKHLISALLLVAVKGSHLSPMPDAAGLGVQLWLSRLLLTLTSSALYHGANDGTKDLFTELILTSSLLEPLLVVLLRRLLLWGQEAGRLPRSTATDPALASAAPRENGPELYHEGCGPSSFLSGVFSFLGLRSQGLNPNTPSAKLLLPWCSLHPRTSCREALFRRSAELLTVLATYRRGLTLGDSCSHQNPALRFLSCLQPSANGERSPSTTSSPRLSPVCLLESIASHLSSCPALAALFYAFMMDNPRLFHHALSISPPRGATPTFAGAVTSPARSPTAARSPAASPPIGSPTPPSAPWSPTRTITSGTSPSSPTAFASSRGGVSVRQIVYQLLEMSYNINQSRFEEALQQVQTNRRGGGADRACGSLPAEPLNPEVLARTICNDVLLVSYPYLEFMTATLLFLLSQDRMVNRMLCSVPLSEAADLRQSPTASWQTTFLHTSYQQHMSLGGLAVVVLCISISHAVRDDNEELATMCAVTLANLSPFIHCLDAGSAQRLLKTILSLLRVLERACQDPLEASSAVPGTGPEFGPQASPAASSKPPSVEFGEMCLRILQVLVESLEGMLLGKNRGNEHVVYELLYSREQLVVRSAASDGAPSATQDTSSPTHSQGQGLTEVPPPELGKERRQRLLAEARQMLRNIEGMVQSYYADIAAGGSDVSAEEIMEVIRHGDGGAGGAQTSIHLSNHAGLPGTTTPAKGEWLLYVYEESASSYNFFGPFVWSTLLANGTRPGGALWAPSAAECPLLCEPYADTNTYVRDKFYKSETDGFSPRLRLPQDLNTLFCPFSKCLTGKHWHTHLQPLNGKCLLVPASVTSTSSGAAPLSPLSLSAQQIDPTEESKRDPRGLHSNTDLHLLCLVCFW
eukprot:gene10746-7474_t